MITKPRNHRALTVICTIVFATFSVFPVFAQCDEPIDVPLIRLIVMPEKYHGDLVRTIGFVRLEFEGNVMYPSKEDCDHALLGNGIWIDLTTAKFDGQYEDGMKYFLIEATFDANDHGHMDLWSGAFTNIKRFEVWSDPLNPKLEETRRQIKEERDALTKDAIQ